MTFRPTVYNNQRPILKASDLGNHPRADEYIRYLALVKYPLDFRAWLDREEHAETAQKIQDIMSVKAMAAFPYCRSPLKIRRHRK